MIIIAEIKDDSLINSFVASMQFCIVGFQRTPSDLRIINSLAVFRDFDAVPLIWMS